MNHESTRELLALNLYGELDESEARELEAHLAGCESCRAFASELEAGLGAVPRGAGRGPSELPSDWLERLARSTTADRPKRVRPSLRAVAASFAAGALFTLGVVTAARTEAPPGERTTAVAVAFQRDSPPPRAASSGPLTELGSYLRR